MGNKLLHKQCKRCKKWKALGEFYKYKGSPDGLGYWCKDCVKKYNEQYYKEYSQTVKGRASMTRRNHTRRVKLKGANKNIDPATCKHLMTLKRNAKVCAICEESFVNRDSRLEKTIDHIVSVSRGGGNNIKNLQVVHRCCNSSKRDKVDSSNAA